MGMFDSMYDHDGNEWQTKAYGRTLERYELGDEVPDLDGWTPDIYQVKVLGGPGEGLNHGFATVQDGVLVEIPSARDAALPLADYFGGII